MDDLPILDASRLTADFGVNEGEADPITNESNRMIAGVMFRQPLLCEQGQEGAKGGEDHERKVKSTCVNIGPVLHQSSSRVLSSAAHAVATSQQRTCNHPHPRGTCCNRHRTREQRLQHQEGGGRDGERVKETPVARMLRYLNSLPPDLSIRKELSQYSFWKSVRTEFIATVMFVAISLGVGIKHSTAPPHDPLTELSSGIASGFITCILMYLTSNQIQNYKSCHLNPCLTLALMISGHHDSRRCRRVSPVRFVCFAAAQLLASITASCILMGLIFNHESLATELVRNNSSFSLMSALPQPVRGMNESNVFGFEFLAAFLVTITYFAVTDDRKARRDESWELFAAESKIQSSSGRDRRDRTTAPARSSHGNQRGSASERDNENKHKNLLPIRETCANGRHHRKCDRKQWTGDPCSSVQGNRCSEENGPVTSPNGVANRRRQKLTAVGEGEHQHSLPNMVSHAVSGVSPNCSPSSSSTRSKSCCTTSTNSSFGSCSFSSLNVPVSETKLSPCLGRFEYVGFAVTTAHLFTVYWVASLLGSIFAAFTYEYIKSSKPETGSSSGGEQQEDAPTSSSESHSGDILSPSGIPFTHDARAAAAAHPFGSCSSPPSPSSSSSSTRCSDREDEVDNNGRAVCGNSEESRIVRRGANGKPNDATDDNGKMSRGEIDEQADTRRLHCSRQRERSQEKETAQSIHGSCSSCDHRQGVGGSEDLRRGCENDISVQRHAISSSSSAIFSGSQMRLTEKAEDSTEMTFISPGSEFGHPPLRALSP